MEQPAQSLSLDDWVDYLGREHMPAMAEATQKLNRLAGDDEARINQLTEQVLKDPSLTSRILQVANGVCFRNFGGPIKTITRAIVMLGFDTMRDIALSMQILDHVLQQNPSQHLMQRLADSFHAAIQARAMTSHMKTAAREEVFIATLLLHFAELSLLARDDEISRRLNRRINELGQDPDLAAREELGFDFGQIGNALVKEWGLTEVLSDALAQIAKPGSLAQAVLLGDELSRAARLGWNSSAAQEVMRQIAAYRGMALADVRDEIIESAATARELAVHYGAARVRHLIPTEDVDEIAAEAGRDAATVASDTAAPAASSEPESLGDALDEPLEDLIELALAGIVEAPPPTSSAAAAPQVNLARQAELEATVATWVKSARKGPVTEVFDGLLTGLLEAADLERASILLLNKEHTELRCVLSRGNSTQTFQALFPLIARADHAFAYCLQQSRPLWMGSRQASGQRRLHTEPLSRAIGSEHYLLAPIVVTRRPVGILFGDREGMTLADEQFKVFCSIAVQAGHILSACRR